MRGETKDMKRKIESWVLQVTRNENKTYGRETIIITTRLNLISLCWCFYNMVPYYLVLHYTYIGRGKSLRGTCTALMYLQQIAGVVALILLWVYLPKEYNFKKALGMSLEFFEAQRSGDIPEGGKVTWRSSSHTEDAEGYDLTGGWY